MVDNTDEVPLENQTNNKPENSSDETTPSANTETIKSIQETENMEVHHHAHHEGKKNWKSYFWEFLMLFLAVFCGFLAEWQLEHTIENSREKEFIASMIQDAQIDTANIQIVLKQNQRQLIYIDSLTTACFNYQYGKMSDYDIYKYYRQILSSTETMKPTERTLTQLKNSGGMRLIRKKLAADIIIKYDGFGKDVVAQMTVLDRLSMDYITYSYELFNFNYFKSNNYVGISKNSLLLSHDKEKLIQFANRITTCGAGTNLFCSQLENMNNQAIKLIDVLKKEYHLTE